MEQSFIQIYGKHIRFKLILNKSQIQHVGLILFPPLFCCCILSLLGNGPENYIFVKNVENDGDNDDDDEDGQNQIEAPKPHCDQDCRCEELNQENPVGKLRKSCNISLLNLLKMMAPAKETMTTTSQKNFLRGAKFSRPANKKELEKLQLPCCRQIQEYHHHQSIAFTDEIPPIKAGLLGEFDPVLLQTQHPGNMKKVWKCISGVHIDIG